MSLTENISSSSCTHRMSNNGSVAQSHHNLRQTPIKREDDRTECETPISSPEFEPNIVVTRNMSQGAKQEEDARHGYDHIEYNIQKQYSATTTTSSLAQAEMTSGSKVEEENDSKDWPMSNIAEPGKNDVLFGRGGGTNHHDGNKRYRKMVEERKVDYVNSKRLDKPLVALDIIRLWRAQKPPGRFLKLDEKTDTWFDVGDKKAREKTSQALREKAPLLRKQQEEQMKELGVEPEDVIGRPEEVMSEGVRPSKNVARAKLAREHSLGCEYIPAEELKNAMKGFSWDSVDGESNDGDSESLEDASANVVKKTREWMPSSNRHVTWSHSGSTDDTQLQAPSHDRPISDIPFPPPSLASSKPVVPSTTTRSFEEYASSYMPPPSMPLNPWQPYQTYTSPCEPGSDGKPKTEWTKDRYGPTDYSPNYGDAHSIDYKYRTHGYWGHPRQWQHSGSDRSLRFTESGEDADAYGSSLWDGYQHAYSYPPTVDNFGGAPNFNQAYENWTSPNRYSSHFPPYGLNFQGPPPQRSPQSASQPLYMDGHQNHKTHPAAAISPYRRGYSYNEKTSEKSCSPSSAIPRPQPIKRDTSHQNETNETKSQVKRMNRQSSIGSRKQSSLSSLGEVSEKDMHNLGKNFRRSSIGAREVDVNPIKKPNSIKNEDRTLTIDQADIASAIEGNSSPLDSFKQAKPVSLYTDGRGNSLESIAMDEIVGLISKPPNVKEEDRSSTLGTFGTIESI